MAKCKDCGYMLQGYEVTCPNCGCPCGLKDNGVVDNDLLNRTKSTKAEEIMYDYADKVLRYGNFIVILLVVLSMLQPLVAMGQGGFSAGEKGALIASGSINAIIIYVVGKFIVKVLWGAIMLYVNMSATLRRIEMQNEKK